MTSRHDSEFVRFSSHARRRARRWNITIDEVTEALANRESERPGEEATRLVVIGITSAGRRLKIVVPVSDQQFVITCAAQGWRR